MKKAIKSILPVNFIVMLGLFLLNYPVHGQDTTKVSSPLPGDIQKIVNTSCMPCHSEKGGQMARNKLNFSDWTQYSPEKQKEKAKEMVSTVVKGTMPPRFARENHPENTPGQEQIDILRKWAESLDPDPKN
jgi:hypothetical protein